MINRKILILFLSLLLQHGIASAGQVNNAWTGKPDIIPTITEQDGSPSIQTCRTLKFSNGSVTDNGDSTCSVSSGAGGGGTVTDVTGTSPISSSGGNTPAISIANAAADGSTKGAASFTAADFNSSTGNISLDYSNGQAASGSAKGFLTSTDWSTFNSKVGTGVTLTAGAGLSGGGDLSTNRSFATDSTEADFLASGALTCGAATQGKIKVHTTALQYCDNAATPTLQYAAYGNSAGVAVTTTALAANGANCSAGQYPLGVDASGAVESCTAVASTTGGICFHFGDGTNVITTGEKKSARREVKKAGTITGWTILSLDDTSGTITLDIWKDTYTNYPPALADSIIPAGTKPFISGPGTKNTSTTLTSWNPTTFSAGDVLSVNVDAVTLFKDIELCLDVTFN